MLTRELNLEIEELDSASVLKAFKDNGVTPAAFKISETSADTGHKIVRVWMDLSEIDPHLPYLLLGYLLGLGANVFNVRNGRRTRWKVLKDLLKFFE